MVAVTTVTETRAPVHKNSRGARAGRLMAWALAAGVALSAPVALADWAGFRGLFKSKSDAAIERGVAVSQAQVADGLKEALGHGAAAAVRELGRPDGFLRNANVRIPMPKHLALIEKGLRGVGQDAKADEFVESMNRAAEEAVPLAGNVIADAIAAMSIDDARGILNGGDTAATEYLRRTSGDGLKARFRPVVDVALGRVGVTERYQAMVDKAGVAAKFIDTDALDLGSYVTDKALDGVFYRVGEEEKKIRENPAARTTALLKQVFAR